MPFATLFISFLRMLSCKGYRSCYGGCTETKSRQCFDTRMGAAAMPVVVVVFIKDVVITTSIKRFASPSAFGAVATLAAMAAFTAMATSSTRECAGSEGT